MKDSIYQWSRLATLGLTVILLTLTGFAVWAAATTQVAAQRTRATVGQSEQFEQARYDVAYEASVQRLYWAQPDPALRRTFRTAAARLESELGALRRAADPDDQSPVMAMLTMQRRYRVASDRLFNAVTDGDQVRAADIDASQIEPLYGALTSAVASSAAAERARAAHTLQTLDATESFVRAATMVIFPLGLLLLGLCSWVVRAYRRRDAEKTQAELARLAEAARTDPLTGLGNHRAFQEEMERAVAYAQRHGTPVSLALVDVDDFKLVNDQHGHARGDEVLAALAGALRDGRAEDRAFRLGGDEFALLLPGMTEASAAARLERLRHRGDAPARAGATVSVGVSALELGAGDINLLREQADAALYEAKRRGRNTVVTFTDIREGAAILSTAKILAVRRLLAEGRIGVAFQPIWNPRKNAVVAFEALARPCETYELAGPQEAFDIAEKIGRAHELDALCRQAILARAHELPAGTQLFLNIAPASLDHDTLAGSTLVEAVEAAGLTASRVVLEITERSLARPGVIIREATRLRSLGFRVALDDVGAGNAGLEMLRQVQVDVVKIDRAVVQGAMTDTTARSVLAAILAFAREARTQVIAEGIETVDMLDLVQQLFTSQTNLAVYGVQGYLVGRPSSAVPDATALARIGPPVRAA